MKTIIYAGGFELPDKNAAAHRVVSNAKILRDSGYRVVFIDVDAEQKESIKSRCSCFGFDRWSTNMSNERLYKIDSLKEVLEYYSNDVLGVIAYNYPSIALNRIYHLCKKRHIKVIADATEWYGCQGGNLIHKVIKGLDSFYRMRIVHKKLDGIIAISHYLENYYKDFLPTVFIPPLCDLTEEKWSQQTEHISDDRLHVLYAGTGGKHKDKLSKILHAIYNVNFDRVCFHVVGLSKEKYLALYPEDKEIVQTLEHSLIFRGRISHCDVIRELKSCDFSLFYRDVTRVTTAGFPTKFAESISAGVPVITNRTSDLVEYLVEGQNGFWIDDLEEDMKRILSMDIAELRKVKNTVDSHTFDYRSFSSTFQNWIKQII